MKSNSMDDDESARSRAFPLGIKQDWVYVPSTVMYESMWKIS